MSFNELFGSIPDGWRSCTLGELVKEFNGSIQTGPFGSQLHAADYVEDGIPSIMPKNIRIDGVDDSDIARVSPEDIERLSKYKVQTGDIVYSRRGDVEKCSLVTEKENGWLCGTGCLRVRLQTEEVSPEFLHAYLCHPAVREWIVRHAVGATMPNLNTSILSALPVLVPTSDSMAVITSNWNALSSKLVINSKINQTLEQMAQAIFKSWFVDFDPVKAKMNGEQPEGMDAATASLFPEKLVESELGLIPEGWDACLIENVTSKVFSGGTPATKNDEFWGGDLPWFSSGETRNNFIIETEKYITEAGVKGSSTKASAYGDILIASAGQGHTRGQTSFNSIDCYINQSVVALRAASNVSAYWLYYCLERRYDEMRSVSDSHSSRGSLTTKLLKGMPAIRPSKDIVNAFDRLVEPLVRKQIANSNQNRELSALRDTLLPKLLSGEIELGATEALELEA
ncbi:restriction endonuclease subunit S [Vibrio harveyi]